MYELVICKWCKSVHVVVLTGTKWMTFESVIQADSEVTKGSCTYVDLQKTSSSKQNVSYVAISFYDDKDHDDGDDDEDGEDDDDDDDGDEHHHHHNNND